MCVDKILSGRPTEEESVVFYSEARTILSEANFNLRSWAFNSTQLCDSAKKDQVADGCEQVNTLGLVWNTASDKLSLAHKVFPLDHSLATKVKYCNSPPRFSTPWASHPQLLLVPSYCYNSYGRRSYHGMIHSHQNISSYGRLFYMIFNNYTLFLFLDTAGRMARVQTLQLNYIYFVTLAPRLMEQWHTFVKGMKQPL